MVAYDEELKRAYLAGRDRTEVRAELGISNNNMSSKSNRLKLHWSWPLKNRVSGIAPTERKAVAKPPSRSAPAPKARAVKPSPRPAPVRPATMAVHQSPALVPASATTETADSGHYTEPKLPRNESTFLSERQKGLRGVLDRDDRAIGTKYSIAPKMDDPEDQAYANAIIKAFY